MNEKAAVERYKELFYHRSCPKSASLHNRVEGSRHKDGSILWTSSSGTGARPSDEQIILFCPYCGIDLHAATRAAGEPEGVMSDCEWDERLAEILEVLIAVGDMPTRGIVRDFVRRAARAELQALYKERPPAPRTQEDSRNA